MTLEKLDIHAAQAICDAATPGPWMVITDSFEPPEHYVSTGYVADGGRVICGPSEPMDTNNDFAFIAFARTALPAALAELAALRTIIANACRDSAEDDTAIRDACRPHLPAIEVDGDNYGVPPASDVVEACIAVLRSENAALRAEVEQLRIAEQTWREHRCP